MTAPAVTPPALSKDEIAKEAAKIADKVLNSSHRRQEMMRVVEDAARLRIENETLKTQLKDTSAKIPVDGVVLTKDQAADWNLYLALGKPADLKTLTTEHGELKTKQAERDLEAQYTEAAEALGWENVAVATRWLKREPIVLTFQDVRTKDDETGKSIVVRTPMVRPKADDKAAPVALADYVDEHAPEFAEIFAAAPQESDEEAGDEQQTRRPVPRGTSANANGGVPIAAMRGARPTSTPAARDKKKMEEIEAAALKTGMYGQA